MRNKAAIVLSVLLACLPILAAAQTDPALDPNADKNLVTLLYDLHALTRIASVAKDLPVERQLFLAIVEGDIDMLRIPRGDGTYQWASLQREEGGRVKDEKSIEQVHTEKELRYVTVTAPNAYRVEITVPKKRGTFAANNRVWVRNVLVDSTGANGKIQHHELAVNTWVAPGDSTGVPLPEIGKSVKATAELGVESGSKAAVAEVALVQAKLVDDPSSPYSPAVKKLLQLRELIAARDPNRGAIKNIVDEALLTLPGAIEKRTAEQAEAARVRKQLAESGTTTGSINLGDATPDVVVTLDEISRGLSGTLQEQTDARARLDALLVTLKPAPVAPEPPKQ